MTDVGQTIAPKSDQLNADDLITGPITITVSKVSGGSTEQPISIHYEGDNDKPYKPCKSMRRVLVQAWGRDGASYRGRRMTLFRDDKVMFGGVAVGGIRISHMSHIDEAKTFALTATRASRKPYTVRPLAHSEPATPADLPSHARGDGADARTPSAPSSTPVDYDGESYDAASPQVIVLAADIETMSERELKAYAQTLRTLIERAPSYAKRAWFEKQAPELVRVKTRSPKLFAWIESAPGLATPAAADDGAPSRDGKDQGGEGAPSHTAGAR